MSEKITILYVDDEELNLELFKINFNKEYNVITAESGKKGLEMLFAFPEIKIVISDMRMPGMSGIEFISIAKREYPGILF